MPNFNPTESDLATSARKYRKELLFMPVIALERSLQHMTLRIDIRHSETVGELSGDIQFRPHDPNAVDKNKTEITPRVLEVYLGSVVKEFNPLDVIQSIYGNNILKGEEMKNVPITVQVLGFLAKKLGANLNTVLFNAVRNAGGSTSKDLFNGFDTITQSEITGSKITTTLGNLYEFGEAIDQTNAVDALKDFFEKSADELQEQDTKLFIPRNIYNAYVRDYQATVGSVPYNTEYKKTFLEGSDNLCELVPLASKKGSNFIHLTTRENMLVGVNTTNDLADIRVEKHHAFLLQFIAACMFGVQFESISKERIFVGKLFQA